MTDAIKKWVTTNQPYFKNNQEKIHLEDFLVDKYSHKKSINFSYIDCVAKAHQWLANLNSKEKENPGKTEDVLILESGMKVVKLLDQESKKWEGKSMSHCVGTANYKEHNGIYSLRDTKNNPHCTIEVKDNEVIQIQGKANSPIKAEYVSMVLSFIEHIGASIEEFLKDESNSAEIGYRLVDLYKFNLLQEHIEGLKYIQVKGCKYIFQHNRLKLKKEVEDSLGFEEIIKSCQCPELMNQHVSKGFLIKINYFGIKNLQNKIISSKDVQGCVLKFIPDWTNGYLEILKFYNLPFSFIKENKDKLFLPNYYYQSMYVENCLSLNDPQKIVTELKNINHTPFLDIHNTRLFENRVLSAKLLERLNSHQKREIVSYLFDSTKNLEQLLFSIYNRGNNLLIAFSIACFVREKIKRHDWFNKTNQNDN